MEAGYAHQAAETEDEPREPEDHDEDEEDGTAAKPTEIEEDEFAVAEREYLNEMRTGMHINEEDGIAV